MNLLNQKIQAIRHTIVRLKRMEALTPNGAERERIRKNIRELNELQLELLEQVGDN